MIIKIKCLNTADQGGAVTLNSEYFVVGFSGNSAIIIDDNGELRSTNHTIHETTYWELVSVNSVGAVAVYP